ncbi:cystin-1 isoform X2 [Perognathus longimembris pacificus]|uniref:cystin-1 isoform X2 n=1 Tax=Perognathus longimembris pacificus TaxID=214514 RepID=UPI002019883B|nr:cystin-1 isoform X2 [Perognathus longimembris pacificus]
MGSGSSRSGRALRQRRGPDGPPASPRHPAAPAGGPGSRGPPGTDPAVGAAEPAGDCDPAASPDGRAETLRLLDQLLAESEAWGPPEPGPRRPARERPAGAPEQKADDHPVGGRASEAPGGSHKRPEGPSAISYDYAEEELMASIERECGR